MMPLIQKFEQISKHDAATAGGKGASLGEMTQAGIPVPPGYVILADAFEQFIEETKLKAEIDSILHRVKKEEMESVERASEEIQALIHSAKMPKDIEKEIKKNFKELNVEFVAVRSSATAEDSSAAAWAGQLDSFLNTTEKTLLQNVQKCWASLFTPRAIFYRFEKGLHKTHISVGVVVQKMVQSEISGIAFSVHPVTQDYNQMIIEGGFGLGEAIVSGQITPDSYVLEKKPLKIFEKNISVQRKGIFRQKGGGNEWKDIPSAEGEKQKLSEKQILELGKLILRIEDHYDFPVDVEWAFEKGKFYITQSRPITTLKDNKNTEKIIPVKLAENENPAPATPTEWIMVRARYVPAVLPILYMWAWPVDKALGASPETLVCIWDKGHFTVAWKKEVLRKLGENAIAKLHATENWNALRKEGIAAGEKAVRFCQKFAAHIKTATPEQISHFLDELKLYYQEIMRTNMIFWVFSGTEIEKQLKHALSTFSQEDQTHILHTMSKSEIASYSQHEEETFEALVELARQKGITDPKVKKGIESFSEKYFWFPFEYVGPIIWTPNIVAERVKEEMKKSPKKKRKENMKKEQSECISKYRLSKEIQHLFKTLQFITLLQDDRKMIHSQVCYYLNGVVLAEVGRRMGMKHGEAYFAENTLIERWAKGEDASHELRERSRFFVAPQTTENYTCLTGKKARDYLAAQKIHLQADFKEVNELIGQSATKGIVKGRVRVVLIASTVKDFKKGEILLAGMTTPDYIPLMKRAGAIVTDEGGITCHAAIVARELGKPCIIGAKSATKIFKDGDYVEVNATKGVIRKLKP